MKHSVINWDQYNPPGSGTMVISWLTGPQVCTYPLHTHKNQTEIMIVTKGKLFHTLNGRTETLNGGDALWISETSLHSLKGEETELVNIAFRSDTVKQLQAGSERPFITKPDTVFSLSVEQVNTLITLCRRIPGSEQENRYLLLELLLYFRRITAEPCFEDRGNDIPEWLQQGLKTVEHAQIPDLHKFYKMCSRTPEHISRVMKSSLGKSPGDYITGLKLKRAVNLLCSSSYSVSYIALEAGFESLPYFFKVFKKQYNCSPGAYRRRYPRTPYLLR